MNEEQVQRQNVSFFKQSLLLMSAPALLVRKSDIPKTLRDELLGQCAPVDNKDIKWPSTFHIEPSATCIRFTTEDGKEMFEITDDQYGFYATHAYFSLLFKLVE